MLPLALALGTGFMQAAQQKQAQDQMANTQAQNMMANAQAMEFSPWTGMGKQMIQGQATGTGADVAAAALEGGLGGYMFGKKNFGGATPKKPSVGDFGGAGQQYITPGMP